MRRHGAGFLWRRTRDKPRAADLFHLSFFSARARAAFPVRAEHRERGADGSRREHHAGVRGERGAYDRRGARGAGCGETTRATRARVVGRREMRTSLRNSDFITFLETSGRNRCDASPARRPNAARASDSIAPRQIFFFSSLTLATCVSGDTFYKSACADSGHERGGTSDRAARAAASCFA